MTDFLAQKGQEIAGRLSELKPHVDEYHHLAGGHTPDRPPQGALISASKAIWAA